MFVVAMSSFFIHEIKTWGQFSFIHIISIFTLFSMANAIYAIRKGNIKAHQYSMQGVFLGRFVIAGAFFKV